MKVEYDLGYKFLVTISMQLKGSFRIVDSTHEKTYNLDIIELTLKDYFVSRRDQMKINQKLKSTAVYVNKQCLFGSLKIQITNMMTKEYAYTGIICKETQIIYRSQEARLWLMVEVSKDLFDTNAQGEVALEFL
jgi:hypothetical protein